MARDRSLYSQQPPTKTDNKHTHTTHTTQDNVALSLNTVIAQRNPKFSLINLSVKVI